MFRNILLVEGGVFGKLDFDIICKLLSTLNYQISILLYLEFHSSNYNRFIAEHKWCTSTSHLIWYFREKYHHEFKSRGIDQQILFGFKIYPYDLQTTLPKLVIETKSNLVICNLSDTVTGFTYGRRFSNLVNNIDCPILFIGNN